MIQNKEYIDDYKIIEKDIMLLRSVNISNKKIMILLSRGWTYKEIAQHTGLTVNCIYKRTKKLAKNKEVVNLLKSKE